MNFIEKKFKERIIIEDYFWKTYPLISGTDEAGRGSLIGPIVVASVVMPINFHDNLIKDSKLLSFSQREKLSKMIKDKALSYSIVFRNKKEIENKNPSVSTKEAFIISLKKLKMKPDLCLVDGKDMVFDKELKLLNIVKGDNLSINISSASILAKVARDEHIIKMHEKYPIYNWCNNKGYANNEHLLAIYKHGICNFHRKNYEPIKSILFGKKKKDEIFNKYGLKIY